MSNDYFTSPSDVVPVTLARSSNLNTLDAAVDAAFDRLPPRADLTANTYTYAADTGAANAYIVALPTAPAAYTDGMEVCFKPENTNSGASTINVNGLGTKTIVNMDGTPMTAGAIPINSMVQLRYNDTTGNFIHMNNPLYVVGGSGYATLLGLETLENKTLNNPVINNPTGSGFVSQAYVDAADGLKANLASPTFTGVPAAPTAAPSTNTTQLATTAFVTTADNLKANLASPTFSGIVSDAQGALRGVPINNQDADYTAALTDVGGAIVKPGSTARAHTIPANATVAFPIGSVLTFINLGGTTNNQTVTRAGSVALYRAGVDANITVTPGDMVTCVKVATNTWQA